MRRVDPDKNKPLENGKLVTFHPTWTKAFYDKQACRIMLKGVGSVISLEKSFHPAGQKIMIKLYNTVFWMIMIVNLRIQKSSTFFFSDNFRLNPKYFCCRRINWLFSVLIVRRLDLFQK